MVRHIVLDELVKRHITLLKKEEIDPIRLSKMSHLRLTAFVRVRDLIQELIHMNALLSRFDGRKFFTFACYRMIQILAVHWPLDGSKPPHFQKP